jgi:putative oxidoreductase
MNQPRATNFTAAWAPRLLSVLRIVAGLLFFAHGVVKLFGYPAGAQPGQVALLSLYGVAAVLEFGGGLALLLGLFTRPIAFLLCGEMAFAYFIGHLPTSIFPGVNGGEPAVLFCFIFLYLAAAGGGPWSLDAKRSR